MKTDEDHDPGQTCGSLSIIFCRASNGDSIRIGFDRSAGKKASKIGKSDGSGIGLLG